MKVFGVEKKQLVGHTRRKGCRIDADEATDEILSPFAQSAVPKMWGQTQHAADAVQTVCPGGPPTQEAQMIRFAAVCHGCWAGDKTSYEV